VRPTPRETVEGVARILREVVSPAVTDAHARGQLAQVIAVLGMVEWDDAVGVVSRSREATETLLAECRAWIEADPERAAHFTLPASPAPDAAPVRFAEANEGQRVARGALEAFIVALRAWRETHDPVTSQDLLDRIGSFLAA
jgi:hypothetical protein